MSVAALLWPVAIASHHSKYMCAPSRVYQFGDSHAGFCLLLQHALTPLLPIITQEQMPDLLHIAVNAWHRDTSIIEALLQHDKQCTCILHNDSSSYNSTCSADNRSSATVLLEQLLLTSFGCYQRNVVQLLGATPAARSLSKGTLLRLLYITLQRDVEERSMGCQPEDLDGNSPSTFGAMCRSPAIQSVSAASIGRLMQVAMGRQQYASVGLLTTLPQAQQLPSQQLCDLLVMLIRAVRGDSQLLADDLGRQALLQRLATLQTGQYLASGDAYRLLTAVLDGRHPVLCMMFQYLAPMHLEHQLTGSELLQLLWQVVRRGSHAWTDLVSLKPAADQINDEAGYVAFLGYAIGAIGVKQVELDPDRIGLDDLANKISLTQRLGVESVVSLLSRCVAVERFHQFVLQIPAIQQLSAEQLEHLLLQVAHAGFLHKLQQLLNLPAAAQMKPMVLQQLVQAVLVRQADTVVRDLRPDLKVIHQLLALPAAGAMTSDAVAEMLQQTCQMLYESSASSSSWNYYGGAGGSKHAVLISIKARLMQLTAALRPTPDSIVPFLQAAIAAEDTEQLSIFSEYPAAKHISSSAAEQLLEAALELGNLKVIRILQEGVPAVAAVTAVVQPTGVQLQRQMAYAIGHQVKHALASLCRHPAASQISTGEMQRLLRDMLRLVGMGCWHVTDADQDPVQLLFCTAAAQALDSAAVVELLESCLKGYGIQQRSEAICISLIALLPASAQVEVHCIENLLSQVLQALPKGGSSHSSSSTTNAWEAFEGFLQLPATQALPSAAVMHQLQTAVEQQVQLQYVQLMASVLPGFQNLSADDFKALMLAAIATKVGTLALNFSPTHNVMPDCTCYLF